MEIDYALLGIFLFRILAALVLGVAIGIERQLGQHPAGVRTNALVCLGSALFVSLALLLKDPDNTRIAAQVVSGIGFICGGAILREGITVRGMNTAATLWCTAAIGCLIGVGSWQLALVGTVAVIVAHFLFRPLAHYIDQYTEGKGETDIQCEVKIVCLSAQEEKIRALLLEQIKLTQLRLQGLSMQAADPADHVEIKAHLFATLHNDEAMNVLVSNLASQEAVDRVNWKKSH
jgi:putative Mg2+ transporter-C (MgtC) family protein